MELSTEENTLADEFDRRAKLGEDVIARDWSRRLSDGTKRRLQEFGYEHGRRKRDGDSALSDIADLEYALGVFVEACRVKLPAKTGDDLPGICGTDEVLNRAENFLWSEWRNVAAFVQIALRAALTHQLGAAISMLYFRGRSIEAPGREGGLFNKCLPVETAAYLGYFKLHYRQATGFDIGTGHGLQFSLQKMVGQGVDVPHVLFDLCAALQRCAANDQYFPSNSK